MKQLFTRAIVLLQILESSYCKNDKARLYFYSLKYPNQPDVFLPSVMILDHRVLTYLPFKFLDQEERTSKVTLMSLMVTEKLITPRISSAWTVRTTEFTIQMEL